MRLFLKSGISLLLLCGPALAFDHADRTSLEVGLQRFAADLEAERLADVDAAIPPRVYQLFVERSGETEDTMRARMIELEARILGDRDILKVGYQTSHVQIATSPDGFDYAFVPTDITTSEGLGPDTTTATHIFAIQDTGNWYFFRLKRRSDFEVIQRAYPDFADIQPPQ